MDIKNFIEMYRDTKSDDLHKMKYKYESEKMKDYVSILKASFFQEIQLVDFQGKPIVFLPDKVKISDLSIKVLFGNGSVGNTYGQLAMEEETAATFDIEGIDYKRESIRKIFAGRAATDKMEECIVGMKKGIEYISNPAHIIDESNLFRLYKLAIWNSLGDEDQLKPDKLYRHDEVVIHDGIKTIHSGIPHEKLPEYMNGFVKYMQISSSDELQKAAIIHFYLSYLHPYFDGNGRMSRLVQMWYLVQRGYPGTMHVSLSKYIEMSRKIYYRIFERIEKNVEVSGVMDITPFLQYMNESVYEKLPAELPGEKTMADYSNILQKGDVTEKERNLWQFVMSAYGTNEFSTKQLEKDFGNAAYATIRTFVMKFEEKGLLARQSYGNRNKYRIR